MKVLSYPVYPDLFSIWFASFTSDPILSSQFGRAVCVRFGVFFCNRCYTVYKYKGKSII